MNNINNVAWHVCTALMFKTCRPTNMCRSWRCGFSNFMKNHSDRRLFHHRPNRLETSVTWNRKPRNRLVIFDKDGTLVNLHAMWGPWIRGFAERIEAATNIKLADKIFDKVSFNNKTGELKPGLLAEGTVLQIRDAIIPLLIDEGVPRKQVSSVLDKCLQSRDMSNYGGVEPIGDLGPLFQILKSKGYRLAVNTSDSRRVTEKQIDALNLRHLIDMVVCGDDEDMVPKPHPSTALKICNDLQVHPSDAIIIGDSTTDLMLAVNAGLKYGIGVLSGITPLEVLQRHTIHIVDDVHQALPIILESDKSSDVPHSDLS